MSLFTTITKGMADGAEALQANFAKLATAITSIGDDGTMTVPNLNVTNLEVNGHAIMTELFNGSVAYNQTGTLSAAKSNFDYLVFNLANDVNITSVWVKSDATSFKNGGISYDTSSSTLYTRNMTVTLTDTTFTVSASSTINLLGPSNARQNNTTSFVIKSVIGVQVN